MNYYRFKSLVVADGAIRTIWRFPLWGINTVNRAFCREPDFAGIGSTVRRFLITNIVLLRLGLDQTIEWVNNLPITHHDHSDGADTRRFLICRLEVDGYEIPKHWQVVLRQQGQVPVSWYQPQNVRKACEYLVFLWKLCNFAIVIEKTRKWVKILF